MTVKFACEKCLQTLVAAEHKIGQSVPCPRCRAALTVPDLARAAALLEMKRKAREQGGRENPSDAASGTSQAATPAATRARSERVTGGPTPTPPEAPGPARDPVATSRHLPAKKTVRSSPPSLPDGKKTKAPGAMRRESPSDQPTRTGSLAAKTAAPTKLEPVAPNSALLDAPATPPEESVLPHDSASAAVSDGILVRRWVLFAQGGLIAVVALVAYVSGYLTGGSGGAAPSPGETPLSAAKNAPVVVVGKVRFRPDRKPAEADGDAVVLALPRGAAVSEKIKVSGLRPEDPRPAENNPQTRILESLDGGYARADRSGNFQLTLRPGPYLVLAISRHAKRPNGQHVPPEQLSLLEQYFVPAKDLVGQAKFEITEREVAEGRPLEFDF